MARLTREAREEGSSTVVVFEGWDAAGKGGAIRRLTRAMEVQDYCVVPVAAPTPEERPTITSGDSGAGCPRPDR